MRRIFTAVSELVVAVMAAEGTALALDWLREFGLQYALGGFTVVYVCAVRVINTRRAPCSSN